jgi:hypothetical protein
MQWYVRVSYEDANGQNAMSQFGVYAHTLRYDTI